MGENTGRRVLRKPELRAKIGLSDSTVGRLEKSGCFPRRISLGNKLVGWFSDEVEDWLELRAGERDGGAT